eukprot:281318-Rhodomonas_salina.1
MVASAGAEAVRLKSGIDNSHCRAMGKADQYLIKERYENRLLMRTSMERALQIAEEHMPRIEMASTKTMHTEVPHLGDEEGKGGEKSKACLSPGEVRKLQTMLSQTGKTRTGAGGASRESCSKRLRAESGHERDKAGGQRKRVPYSELPSCDKCGGKHPGADKGECLMFDCISTIIMMEKKGASGPGMHKAMAAELRRMDRESWDGDSEDEYVNERNGNYNVSPSQRSLVPSTARVCRTRFTTLRHA